MVHLIEKDGKPIGWEMRPTTPEEQEIAATIRDLQFFGFDETKIVYGGLEFNNPEIGKEMGNIRKLKWVQKQHDQ